MSKSRNRRRKQAEAAPVPKIRGDIQKQIEHCERKRRFNVQVKADVMALAILNHRSNWKKKPKHLKSYHCPVCGGYHLTSQR